jgi:penicillin-binding protein 1A
VSLVRTLLSGLAVTVLATSVSAGALGIAYLRQVAPTLPDHMAVRDWKPREGTRILAADGTVIGTHSRERRTFAPIATVPKLVVDAFLAAEDADFWKHDGIDPAGVARAVVSNLRSLGGDERAVGGSTITQQVVKNVILTPERTLDRKVREAILAMRVERDVGKARILEVYLNEIYFGAGAYGVAEAAKTYFGKDLASLSLAEAALLAGLPKAPGSSDPFRNPARAKDRRDYVLRRMVEERTATPEAAAAARATPVSVVPRVAGSAADDPAFWYVEEEVRRRRIAEVGVDAFYGKGGTVSTTIDPAFQRAAHAALRAGLLAEDRRGGYRGPLARVALPVDWSDPSLAPPPGSEDWRVGVVTASGRDAEVSFADGTSATLAGPTLSWAGSSRADRVLRKGDAVLVADGKDGPELAQVPEVQGALVVMDPRSGAVLALDGGFSHETSEFNRATQAKRQTGSVFKTFVYLAALEIGYDPTSPVLDSPIALDQGQGMADWRPQDAGGKGEGLMTLRHSLEKSKNMSTVRLLYDIGAEAVLGVASRVGLSMPGKPSYSMALGAAEATPFEIASAYAVVAGGGKGIAPRLSDADRAAAPAGVDPIAAAQVSSILRGVVTDGTARRAFQGFDKPIAAKTGTTNEARDAWLVAFGPSFVAAAWVGRDDHKPLRGGASGGGSAGPVVRGFLDRMGDGIEYPEFPLPEGAVQVPVDGKTGTPREDGDMLEIMRDTGGVPAETTGGTVDARG